MYVCDIYACEKTNMYVRRCQSGQLELIVNPRTRVFVGSNPTLLNHHTPGKPINVASVCV